MKDLGKRCYTCDRTYQRKEARDDLNRRSLVMKERIKNGESRQLVEEINDEVDAAFEERLIMGTFLEELRGEDSTITNIIGRTDFEPDKWDDDLDMAFINYKQCGGNEEYTLVECERGLWNKYVVGFQTREYVYKLLKIWKYRNSLDNNNIDLINFINGTIIELMDGKPEFKKFFDLFNIYNNKDNKFENKDAPVQLKDEREIINGGLDIDTYLCILEYFLRNKNEEQYIFNDGGNNSKQDECDYGNILNGYSDDYRLYSLIFDFM